MIESQRGDVELGGEQQVDAPRAGGMTRAEEPAVNPCTFAKDVSCLDLVTNNHNQLIFFWILIITSHRCIFILL